MKEELVKRLRVAFQAESEERLKEFSVKLMELEQKGCSEKRQREILEILFREAHSLKGAARAVNLSNIEMLCQAMEAIFAALKRAEMNVSNELFDALHESERFINRVISDTDGGDEAEAGLKTVALVKKLQAVLQKKGSCEVGKGREADKRILSTPEHPVSPSNPNGKEGQEGAGISSGAGRSAAMPSTVRIETEKLDTMLLKAEEMLSFKQFAGQLVTDIAAIKSDFDIFLKKYFQAAGEIRQLHRQLQTCSLKNGHGNNIGATVDSFEFGNAEGLDLARRFAFLSRNMGQYRYLLDSGIDALLEDLKKATMLPFESLFALFPGMVREIAKKQGKQVNFIMQGSEIKISRRILEELKDPLIHLLRNCIDHGLESPENRVGQGKSAEGTVSIIASPTEDNKVEIRVSDDGRGIDSAALKKYLQENDIIGSDDLDAMDSDELLDYIFHSGVSTSRIVTDLSGRGLGLAIVKERVESFGGRVDVGTTDGEGTSFRLRLPVTLANFKGILVEEKNRRFVMPASYVETVLRVRQDDVKSIENRAAVPYKGHQLSLVSLAEVLNIQAAEQEKVEDFVQIAVLKALHKKIGFKVDRILGEREVLVKDLGPQLKRVRNIAGATILGSGEIVPVLHVTDLIKSATSFSPSTSLLAGTEDRLAAKKSIMIVEDSITSRMLLKNILEGAGYLVVTAVDGADAHAKLKTEVVDLVVSDVEMPRMTGFELTKKIREAKDLAEKPVILITSLESVEDRERGIDAGANAYIVKSDFDQSNLLEMIRRFI